METKKEQKLESDHVRLIISDLHLGSACAKESALWEFLTNIEFDELILNGDIIDFIKIPRFTQHSALLFKFVSDINVPVTYVVGNHDIAFTRFIGKSVGNIRFVDKYDFAYSGRDFRIVHGDRYDKSFWHQKTEGFLIKLISIFQDLLERRFDINLASWWVSRHIKKRKLIRIWDIINLNNDVDVFIMGHSHMPEAVIWVDKEEQIKTYVNTGDWVDNCTYVIVKDGQVRLRKYQANNTE
jgi:UDP-2,3-diacylglucosamine pyrophosphatase LpxH